MALLDINRVAAFYGKAQALKDVSIQLQAGTITAVIGANGAGKSTLFDAIMGMVELQGSIKFNGVELTTQSSQQIIYAGVGYAPERAHLFPFMSVEDNLLVGAYTARDDIQKNLRLVHDLFPILKERRRQETHTQSGGERQMVSLGRALMSSPTLLLVDEPTIGLSPKVCLDIAAALQRLNREHGMTILIAEQNVNFALSLAQNLYVIETGAVKVSGATQDLAEDPVLKSAYFGSAS